MEISRSLIKPIKLRLYFLENITRYDFTPIHLVLVEETPVILVGKQSFLLLGRERPRGTVRGGWGLSDGGRVDWVHYCSAWPDNKKDFNSIFR